VATTATAATATTPTAASFATAAASPATGPPGSPPPPPGEERIERWREDVDAREGSVSTTAAAAEKDAEGTAGPVTRASTAANPLRLEGSQSFMFWNLSQYEDRSGRRTDSDDDAGHAAPADQNGREDEDRRCPRCGGTSVREKEGRSWGFARSKSLVCGECGLEKKGVI
jgi:hypothetical protein